MPGVVCAIRGGPASRPTITRAIRLAEEVGQPLYFLYVVNLDFLTFTSSTRTHTISEEMSRMGEFILLAAQDAAARRAVSAEGLVRHGNVGQEIIGLCHELEADYLVLGWPRIGRGDTVFTRELLDRFIEQTEEQTGARVVLPEGEFE